MITPRPLDRRRWLASVGSTLALSTLGCERRPDSSSGTSGTAGDVADSVLARALRWLWSKQSTDGSWRSETYALLKSGRTLTPFLLHALQQVRYESPPRGAHWTAAYEFVRRSVAASGAVEGGDDDVVEYPTYATALALQTFVSASPEYLSRDLRVKLMKYLIAQQFGEAGGGGEADLAYGGFSFGTVHASGKPSGHVDIGHTRHALEALRAAGYDDAATYRRAERFLRLLQKHPTEDRRQPTTADALPPTQTKPPYDGGFYFSPVVLAANKAGTARHDGRAYYRSYATATCDGILALLVCGVPRNDERIIAARKWLEQHPELDYPGGIPLDTNENWRASIRFYHFAVRAECYAALEWPGPWRAELRDILAGLQWPDGSFANRAGALMKEDDPLLCTGLAVIALSRCAQA